MPVQNIGGIAISLNGKVADFQNKFRGAGATLTRLSQKAEAVSAKFESVGRAMTYNVSMPIAAAMGASVRAFSNFDIAMTESLAIMGQVSDQMRKEMRDTALSLSGEIKYSARELAQGYFYLASAGMDAAQSMRALPTSARFAMAGVMDQARATELLADSQAALGLKVADSEQNMRNMTRVSDVLVKANTLAQATTEQFAEALANRAAASMRLSNIELEEGVAVLAAFAMQGRKGQEAGRALSIVLRDLQRVSLKNKDMFQIMGVRVFDADGAMRKMADIVYDLERAMDGLSVAQRRASLQTMGFQQRSLDNLLTIIGFSKEIREFYRILKIAGGTTKEVADKQMTAFGNQVKMVRNQVVNVGIDIGNRLQPKLQGLMQRVSKATRTWSKYTDAQKKTRIQWGLWIAAIGPGVGALGTIGKVLFGTTIPALKATYKAIMAFPAKHPVTALIAGSAGAGYAAGMAIRQIPAVQRVSTDIWTGFLDMIGHYTHDDPGINFDPATRRARRLNRERWKKEGWKKYLGATRLQEKLTEENRQRRAETRLTAQQRARVALAFRRDELEVLERSIANMAKHSRERTNKQFAAAVMFGASGSTAAAESRRTRENKALSNIDQNTKDQVRLLKEEITKLEQVLGIVSGENVRVYSLGG